MEESLSKLNSIDEFSILNVAWFNYIIDLSNLFQFYVPNIRQGKFQY